MVGRPSRQFATTSAAPGLSGSEQRFSTTTRSAGARASATSPAVGGSPASMARPGKTRSTDPSPATVQTVKPRARNAEAHLAASTATPSGPPRRNDTMATVGTVARRHATVLAVADELLYELANGVARLTINRPERRNAISWGVISGLREALARAKDDAEVRVVVLTGAGEKAFCAGADLGGMADGDDGFLALHEGRGEMARLFEDLWQLGKPTIARVRGYALAGGFGLALACDFVVAADDACFGTPEVDVGLWPYMITVPLVRSMPPKKALELMLTGRRVNAEEADRLGL